MATGATGFSDLAYDLISVQYHGLKDGHDLDRYVKDAETAGEEDIADFFRAVMQEDAARARRCHEFLSRLTHDGAGGPAIGGESAAGGRDTGTDEGSPIVAGPESRERSAVTR
ncbi:acyl carrier protein [Streptomyces sp. NPDC005728]|uniref:acyl carrier protein n=1 Tax=Streptomyces sp. NPDC005728 TaxID=3157054 RepID=UPI00340CF7F0